MTAEAAAIGIWLVHEALLFFPGTMAPQAEFAGRQRQQMLIGGRMQIVTQRARFLLYRLMHHPSLKRFAVMAGKAEAVVQPGRLGHPAASRMAGLALPLGKGRVILRKQEFIPGTAMGVVAAMTALLSWKKALVLGRQLIRLHGMAAQTESAHCFFEQTWTG